MSSLIITTAIAAVTATCVTESALDGSTVVLNPIAVITLAISYKLDDARIISDST